MGVVVIAPLPPMLSKALQTVGSLCSPGITPLHHYYGPLRHPRVFSRFPGVAGYTGLPCSSDFALGRGGLLQLLSVSSFPCRRSHPARVVRRVSQSATAHAAFTFPVAGSASGAAHFRGHLCVRLRYSLETRPHPTDEAVERLQKVGFPSPCSPSYRALAFSLVGFSPTEHASLSWTHHRTCGRIGRQRVASMGTFPTTLLRTARESFDLKPLSSDHLQAPLG